MIRTDVLAAILAMAAVTYLCRAGGYAILRAVRAPRFVERLLQHLPGPLFCAYVAPSLAQWGWTGWAAAMAVVAAQYVTGNLAAAILAGAAAMAGLQMLG
ncbi:MAG TPA: AzlD domain-containing protein [Roseomonas sp.]|jgi:branched-subunit amino acid transport protein